MIRRADEADELWAAVADPTRRRLLDVLLAQGEATATTLAAELPVTRQAVAKHLGVLDRNPELLARLRGRTLARREELTWEQGGRDLEGIYRRLLTR